MDERIWLKHKETGGYFHCPPGVVDTFKDLGWEPADEPPPEPDPVVAERIAYEKQLAEEAAAAAGEATDTSTRPRRGTIQKEG